MSLVKNLHIKFEGDFDLKIDELKILDDGITCIMGPSGSGKSTFFNALIGAVPAPQMSWSFKDEDLNTLSISERRLGVVSQNYDLFPHMTGLQNLKFAAKARGVEKAEQEKLLAQLNESLKISSFYNKNVNLLSGGEQQRIAIARALIGKPRVLLLDEPFASLDSGLRAESRNLIKSIVKEYKIPTLLITHDKSDADALADALITFESGRIKES